jgi:hypothetical protein
MEKHTIHEHHQKAAEHHEHAARHHREAAKHAPAGHHEKAATVSGKFGFRDRNSNRHMRLGLSGHRFVRCRSLLP